MVLFRYVDTGFWHYFKEKNCRIPSWRWPCSHLLDCLQQRLFLFSRDVRQGHIALICAFTYAAKPVHFFFLYGLRINLKNLVNLLLQKLGRITRIVCGHLQPQQFQKKRKPRPLSLAIRTEPTAWCACPRTVPSVFFNLQRAKARKKRWWKAS